MQTFFGRARELVILNQVLRTVETGDGAAAGRCLLVRGRRRVGKSRLIEEFVERAGLPSLYFTATREGVPVQLERLRADAAESSLPQRDLLIDANPHDWDAAFRFLTAALPDDRPSAVVIDEVPYLMDEGYAFESVLQRAWDRHLSRKPVLLILVGSDLSMMEALNTYDRPFHQRGREMVIGPLSPADISDMVGLPAADAFDAALVTGGLPLVCAEWQTGTDVWTFLARALADPLSALLVSAERTLAAEFPVEVQARAVLTAIGTGERTFSGIGRTGGLADTPLRRSLSLLADKRIVRVDQPLSTRTPTIRHYGIADPYLSFWLRFVRPSMADIERGRGDAVLQRVRRSWNGWRGSAIEPLVRESLARLVPDDRLPTAEVGSYWTRSHNVEIDIVGADRQPVARRIGFVGSIKWRESAPFRDEDLSELVHHRSVLTDELVPLVAVSRSGVRTRDTTPVAAYGPDDLLAAWQR